MKPVNELLRENIRSLEPYHSAREHHQGGGLVYLDANENPFGRKVNRYPDPHQRALKDMLAGWVGLAPEQVFPGNGSDEVIDLLIRTFVEPHIDNLVLPDPTYGMYEVAARVQGAEVRKVPLKEDFQPDVSAMISRVNDRTKLIFLCSPNNPTGNLVKQDHLEYLLRHFEGLVVVDEAYVEFTRTSGFLALLKQYPNLVLLRTFSKALGMAGIRLGYALAGESIVRILTRIKPPYNVNRLTQQMALRRGRKPERVQKLVNLIVRERARLSAFLNRCRFVEEVYPAQANFLLVRVKEPDKLVKYLKDRGIIIRNRSHLTRCERSVRITIGKPRENKRLMKLCRQFDQQYVHF